MNLNNKDLERWLLHDNIEELQLVTDKAISIIKSCNTIPQLNSARQYVELYYITYGKFKPAWTLIELIFQHQQWKIKEKYE